MCVCFLKLFFFYLFFFRWLSGNDEVDGSLNPTHIRNTLPIILFSLFFNYDALTQKSVQALLSSPPFTLYIAFNSDLPASFTAGLNWKRTSVLCVLVCLSSPYSQTISPIAKFPQTKLILMVTAHSLQWETEAFFFWCVLVQYFKSFFCFFFVFPCDNRETEASCFAVSQNLRLSKVLFSSRKIEVFQSFSFLLLFYAKSSLLILMNPFENFRRIFLNSDIFSEISKKTTRYEEERWERERYIYIHI